MQGRVHVFHRHGYGFIIADSGESVYFHITDVRNRSILRADEIVRFDVIKAPKGLRAKNVEVIAVETGDVQHVANPDRI